MIPNFKTYLTESIWGDIRQKSLGKESRKEEDVNNLSPEGLKDYIKENYAFKSVGNVYLSNMKIMSVSIGEYARAEIVLYFNFHEKVMYMFDRYSLFKKMGKVFKNSPYSIESPGGYIYVRQSDDFKGYNKFIIDIIDFMIDNMGSIMKLIISRKTNESVWSDLRKKSLGQEDRVENRVDFMSADKLMHYLYDYYEIVQEGVTNAIFTWEDDEVVTVMVFLDNPHEPGFIEISNPGTDKAKITIPANLIRPTQYTTTIDIHLRNKILDNFKIESQNDRDFCEVYPNDGSKVTNQFYIYFIDFLLDNTDDSKYRHFKIIGRK